jgi:3-hydroxymyristoyl/3-hydroxydecanoyl-(acyl carrier protein) dehydratase
VNSTDGGAIAFDVPADHPAFAGHFPGAPVLPGALLLDEALRRLPLDGGELRLDVVKFRRAVRPGAQLALSWVPAADGLRFLVHEGATLVMEGLVATLGEPAP